MPLFLDTRGNSTVSIAICDRCHRKFPYDQLRPDANNPALRVCKDDMDVKDPYKLPPRKTEKISLRYPRNDSSVVTNGQSTYTLITQDTNINAQDDTLNNGS
jgi:hypothetical protein